MTPLYKRIVEAFGTDNGAEIARLVEVNRQAVYRWRDRDTEPAQENLLKITKCTGVTLDWLLTGKGEKFPAQRQLQSAFTVRRSLKNSLTRLSRL